VTGPTLGAALRAAADREADAVAVVDRDCAYSYADLLGLARDLARGLDAGGVRAGRAVAIVLPNGVGFVAAFFAIADLGAIAVPVDPQLQEAELGAVLAAWSVGAVVCAPCDRARCASALARAGLASAPVIGAHGAPRRGASPARPRDVSPSSDVLGLSSSGSTGRPKRVARTHAQLLHEVERLSAALDLSPRDRVIGAAPFSHVNGLVRSMLTSALAGATLLTIPEFDRHVLGRLVERHAATVFIGVPVMFAALADTRWPAPVCFASLRRCLSASAPLPARVAARFRERYGVGIGQVYGTTETGTVTVSLDPRDAATPDSVGRPLPGVAVEVFGEDGHPCPAGTTGRIGVRSPSAIDRYAGDEDRAAFAHGYFFPGDLGWKDEQGRLYLAGRTSLFINRGGHKVNPLEVEELLEQHPKVLEAAVVGVESPQGDQRVKAVLVCAEPCAVGEIIEFCRGRIAPFKIPSIVEFRRELPRSSAGKLLRPGL